MSGAVEKARLAREQAERDASGLAGAINRLAAIAEKAFAAYETEMARMDAQRAALDLAIAAELEQAAAVEPAHKKQHR